MRGSFFKLVFLKRKWHICIQISLIKLNETKN